MSESSLWNRSLAELFDEQARRRPQNVAIDAAGRRRTYAELASDAERCARGLRRRGVVPGAVVAVAGPRGGDAILAILGVVYAGATYLPVDTVFPADRIRAMLRLAGAGLVVRWPGAAVPVDVEAEVVDLADVLADGLGGLGGLVSLGGLGSGRLELPGAADALATPAYVMFTSGSTGEPKAVPAPQRGVARIALDNGFMNVLPEDRVLHAASLSFDASTLEIWATLLNGACLVPVEQQVLLAPYELHRRVERERISIVWLTTSIFHHVARERPETFAGLRYVLAGGEAMRPDAARRVLEHGRPLHLINGYGPTEATVFTLTHDVQQLDPQATSVPIGRPVADTVCHVLRADGTPTEPGEEGELYIGGGGVARGYLDNPRESAERFRVLTVPGGVPQLLYRTGDFVRRRPDGPDGLYEFRGRRDDQVKVRGFRIELEEVRAALVEHPDVADAVVLTHEDDTSRYLAAHAAGRDPAAPPTGSQLRAYLAGRLPAFMVPAVVTVLDRLPLLANGKVDRAALSAALSTPRPRPDAPDAPNALAAPNALDAPDDDARPRSTRQAVAEAWAAALPDGATGEGSFAACGGSSLQAAQLVIRLQHHLQVDSAHGYRLVTALFAEPTMDAFTAAVERIVAEPAPTSSTGDRWREDLTRDAPPVLAEPPAPRPQAPRNLLLTGATGFLGSRLLDELLARTDADVHVLVRARDTGHARRRLLQARARYGIAGDLPDGRVHPLPGDLALPRLGLDDATWEHQAATADAVHHCGAHANFLYPYEQLRPANVDGTREIIALASRRAVPVHYISTVGVVRGIDALGVRHLTEDTPVDHVELLSMGYYESKWVAEQLIRDAAARGLPTAVYRPYDITGDTVTHTWDHAAALSQFFRLIVELGLAPDWDLPLNLVPSDVTARAVVHLSLTQPARGRTFHIVNPRACLLDVLVDRLRHHGYPLRTVPYGDWCRAMTRHLADHPDHPFGPFEPLFTNPAATRGITVAELSGAAYFPRLDHSRLEAGLAGSGITCPPVDHVLLDNMIHFFHRTGHFPPPAAR
ncbi:amino acid adenylation domain-containing protein [Kitasatospora sp. NPDC089797]|uniref:amino acid adenylation domain-containing protein n=1 Tax=Kitasatospora sp. NPDC089797 TaxID=3155298 RepID=UPI00341402D1